MDSTKIFWAGISRKYLIGNGGSTSLLASKKKVSFYKTIVDITEKACTCAARQVRIADTETSGCATCRMCKVLGVLNMFTNVINLLISAKGTPERL